MHTEQVKRWDGPGTMTLNRLLRAIDAELKEAGVATDPSVRHMVFPAMTIGTFTLTKVRKRYPNLCDVDISRATKHGDTPVQCDGGLRCLVLPHHSKMTDVGFANFVQMQSTLKSIELVNCVFVTNISMQLLINTCLALRQVKLLKCKWADNHTMKILCGVGHTPLDVIVGKKRARPSSVVPLEHIEITECDLLYSNSIQYLENLADSLEAINLSGCGMVDGVSAAYLAACTALVSIDLECTCIDDASVRVLSSGCKCLRQLGMGSCEQITALALWWLTPKPIAHRLPTTVQARFERHVSETHQSDVMLTQLSIRACRRMDHTLVFLIIDAWPRLVHLDCGGINGGYSHLDPRTWEESCYGVLCRRSSQSTLS